MSVGIMTRTFAIVLAAGQSRRLGGDIAKPWRMLAGRPVLDHAVSSLAHHPKISGGVIVASASALEDAHALANPHGWRVVEGGKERAHSVKNGLSALSVDAVDHVLIHDAARPFIPDDVINRLIQALDDGADGVIPTLPSADSLKRIEDGQVQSRISRDGIDRVQTPQGFRYDLIAALHQADQDGLATDDSSLLEDGGYHVQAVAGDPILDKITSAADLTRAEFIALGIAKGETAMSQASSTALTETRMATGFDVHAFNDQPGPIMLGGVAIDHDRGFDAHSDGDVALHALTDALYGTMADGDIGAHFPPSDDQWKGKDSAYFLQAAANQLAKQGGRITLADLTIIAEAPKITPHRDAIRRRIADLLDLDLSRVSVKATTTEQLGFTGRREGIAVQAAVTITLPIKTQ
jgi:2-C-methyl-D-erythritol 4-phosphate cytidylyltransferase/2-C-methyl-D-erythritol 2,4-cyclodiphosphate synthase